MPARSVSIPTWVRRNLALLDCLLILAVALALRLPNLESWPRWFVDEGSYGIVGVNLMQGIVGDTTRDPNFPTSLFFLITGLATRILGESYFAIRLPGALVGAASCVVVYLLGRQLYGRSVGLMAGLFAAVATTYMNRTALIDNFVAFFFLLSALLYLMALEQGGKGKAVLAGVMAGLAILTKYSGIIAPLSFFVLSGIWRKATPLRPATVTAFLVSLGHPLAGAVFGWQEFWADSLAMGGRPPQLADLLRLLIMGRPIDQLRWEAMMSNFNLWATLGFVFCLYLLARNRKNDQVVVGLFMVTVLSNVILGGSLWWAYLIPIYPIYALALAAGAHAVATRREGHLLLSLMTLFLLLMVTSSAGPARILPQSWARLAFYGGFALTLGGWLTGGQGPAGVWLERLGGACRRALPLYTMAALAGATLITAASDFPRLLSTAEVGDQKATVAFLNSKGADKVVAAATTLGFVLKGEALPYSHVAFYNSNVLGRYLYDTSQLQRYHTDLSLDRVDYFVMDGPFGGLQEYAPVITPTIEGRWDLVFRNGDYRVYANPARKRQPWWLDLAAYRRDTDPTRSLDRWSPHAGNPTLSTDKAGLRVASSDSTSEWLAVQYSLGSPRDWSKIAGVEVSLWVSQGEAVRAVRIGLVDAHGKQLVFEIPDWEPYRWRRLQLPFSGANQRDAAFDITSVTQVYFGVVRQEATDLVFWVSDPLAYVLPPTSR